jgi:predicted CoA-binding protein
MAGHRPPLYNSPTSSTAGPRAKGDTAGLTEIFAPRSIAVLGASNRPGTVGASLVRNIPSSGYSGVVHPVNPSWKSVSGVRCYPRLRDLPGCPEQAIVIGPAPAVTPVVEQLGRLGTKGVVVISAGLREIGGAGVAREAALVRVARRHRISLVGPNCFGVLTTDPSVSLNATSSETLPDAATWRSSRRAGRSAPGSCGTARRNGSDSPGSFRWAIERGSTRTSCWALPPPIRPLSDRRLVAAVRGAPLLDGVRGEAPSDLPALVRRPPAAQPVGGRGGGDPGARCQSAARPASRPGSRGRRRTDRARSVVPIGSLRVSGSTFPQRQAFGSLGRPELR